MNIKSLRTWMTLGSSMEVEFTVAGGGAATGATMALSTMEQARLLKRTDWMAPTLKGLLLFTTSVGVMGVCRLRWATWDDHEVGSKLEVCDMNSAVRYFDHRPPGLNIKVPRALQGADPPSQGPS